MILVFLQPDLGSALVYVGALAGVLFLSGVRWLHLVCSAWQGSSSSRVFCGFSLPPGFRCSSRTRPNA